jgi:hypothetical protein
MHSWFRISKLLAVIALFSPLAASAQYAADPAGCACCGTFFFIPLVFLALSIAILVWVARDAKARGMDSAILWMLLVFLLNLPGLVIYLLARPQGITVPCPNCGNSRLQSSLRCPHCGLGA